jgi:hypothetical protein
VFVEHHTLTVVDLGAVLKNLVILGQGGSGLVGGRGDKADLLAPGATVSRATATVTVVWSPSASIRRWALRRFSGPRPTSRSSLAFATGGVMGFHGLSAPGMVDAPFATLS